MSMFAMGMGVIFLVDCVHINIYKYIYNVFLVFLCRVYFIHIYGIYIISTKKFVGPGLMRKKKNRKPPPRRDQPSNISNTTNLLSI